MLKSPLPPAATIQTAKLKTAVIGYGLSARTFHLPFIKLQPELELVAISSSQPELAIDYPKLTHYPDATTLITESDAELSSGRHGRATGNGAG